MTIAEVRELFSYNAWANARVFAAVEALTGEQLTAQVASSFSSVRATIGHIVGAEWIWLRRWRGENPVAPAWATNADLPELRQQLAVVETDRTGLLASLTDADLDRAFAYRNLKGDPQYDKLGGTLQHVVNHSTYHRGQVATQLRQLGCTPPNTDLITYLRLRK